MLLNTVHSIGRYRESAHSLGPSPDARLQQPTWAAHDSISSRPHYHGANSSQRGLDSPLRECIVGVGAYRVR
jgi:hypothetical protein